MPKIIQVKYEGLFNLGDYQNEKIGFVATIEGDENPEDVVDLLRQKAISKAGTNVQKIYDDRWKAERELRQLNKELESAKAHWDQVSAFLKAQGINPNAPAMPIFAPQLAPAPDSEAVEVVELDEYDDEYDDE